MSVAFGPDGKTIAVATVSRLVKLWSLTSNRELAELKYAGGAGLWEVALSDDGRTLAARGPGPIWVWNLDGADERLELAGHSSGVTSESFSPDGATLASTSKEGTVKLWEPATGRLRRTLGGYPDDVQCSAFSPDGTLLATGSFQKGRLRIWDTRSWQEVYAALEDAEHVGNVTGLAFLRGAGKELGLAATSRESGLGVWRVKRDDDGPLAVLPIVQRPAVSCFHLASSPDCRLAAFIDAEVNVRVWDLLTARGLAFNGPRALFGWHSLAFRSPRELVYIASDGVAVVWDVTENRLIRTIGRPGTFEGFHIAVSPDGRWLAAETTPTSAAVVDLDRGEIVLAFRDERSPIWSLAWSPDARRLSVGLSDGGLVLWDLERVRTVLLESGIAAPSTSAHREEPQGIRPAPVLDLDHVASLHRSDMDLARAAGAARSSRWEEAAAIIAQILKERTQESATTWFEHAILRLAVGDADGYRSACRSMVEASRKHTDQEWLELTAHACALAPDGPGEQAQALRLAEECLSAGPDTTRTEHVLGLALYRAGRFAEADVKLRAMLKNDPAWNHAVLNAIVMTMAQQRLGRARRGPSLDGRRRTLGRAQSGRPCWRGRPAHSAELALA